MTTTQLATLAADIAADPALSPLPVNEETALAIQAAYDVPASPAYIVWKTRVTTREIKDSVNWTEYIARSAGERGAFELMIADGSIDPSRANVRSGLSDVFSGTGGQTSRAALLALSKRSATRAEKLFAAGTGSDASPAVMTVEGRISTSDINAARST